MTPTADHDANLPPLYSGPVGTLVAVRLDGRRWVVMPPGDPVADHLADHEMEREK